MKTKYNVESKQAYTQWNTVKGFDIYKDAVDYKRNNCVDSNFEYRIVKCETVTITTDVKKLMIERS
jgi:hypothetical protein